MKHEAGRNNGWDPEEWIKRMTEEVEPWPDPVDGKALLDEMSAAVQRVVVLGQWAVEAICLWVLHSYAFELRDITTYLGIESPQHRCGKSTLLDLLGLLVNRPVRAANISPPAFYRAIEEKRPVLLIDETDTFLHTEELRGIFNAGYQRDGAFVIRVASEVSSSGTGPDNGGAGSNGNRSERASRLVTFSCWCPKAIARIGRLPQTLADRCIVIVMQRKLPSERCERLRDIDALALRRKCARFVVDHAEAIASAKPAVPQGLNDRAADIWEPLLALADLAGGDWPDRARQAALGLSVSAQESDPMGSLLMDILELFLRSGEDRHFSRTIAEWLKMSEERPWTALKRGQTVTPQWLAQQLHTYGVRPKTMRIGSDRAKGYEREDFTETFRRYIPQSEIEAFKKELKEQSAQTNQQTGAEPAQGEEVNGASGQRCLTQRRKDAKE
jgi:putative DNA primase/helicase